MEEVPTTGQITDDQVTMLEGHTSEVFICAWNPVNSLLASG
jgi:transducin (beta)-like 1